MRSAADTSEGRSAECRIGAPDLPEIIRSGGLIPVGARVAVGVSGGPDSMALLHALSMIAPETELRLVAAHLDHALREGSAEDAAFVRDQARARGLECIVERSDVREVARSSHRSLEDAGRRARYAFFERVCAERRCELVAVGHTADDQAETVLFHVLRGSGLDGAAGMAPDRPLSRSPGAPRLVRPLLEVWRDDVLAYCQRMSVSFLDDASNRLPAFTRNRIRRELLPLLEANYNPHVKRHLVRLSVAARESSRLHRALATDLLARVRIPGDSLPGMDLGLLRSVPAELAAATLRLAFADVTQSELTLDWTATARLMTLLAADGPREVDLLGGWRAEVTSSDPANVVLRFRRGARLSSPAIVPRRLPIPGRVEIPEAGLFIESAWADPPAVWPEDPDIAFIDPASLAGRLTVRGTEPGDRFLPFGFGGCQKVSEFLIDRKVPRSERPAVPIVVDAEKILWIAGQRLDDRARLRPDADRAIRLVLGRLRQ
jgi:tRNA(Ile)-lysidine synthase